METGAHIPPLSWSVLQGRNKKKKEIGVFFGALLPAEGGREGQEAPLLFQSVKKKICGWKACTKYSPPLLHPYNKKKKGRGRVREKGKKRRPLLFITCEEGRERGKKRIRKAGRRGAGRVCVVLPTS